MNITSNSTTKDIPRQRWLRIIPPILITCIISYMDRVNIAFAMPGGMDADLGISATMAGLAGGIFFIGYLFLQVPGGKIAVHGSGKKFIGWSLVAWAVISVLTGLITNQYQLLALRFLLGVAEGGMLPVVLTMISNWFPDAERGRANAIVIMFVPIAGIITAPLSGWIITVLDWRWLFIIEGLFSLVFRSREALSGRDAGRGAKSHCRHRGEKRLSERRSLRQNHVATYRPELLLPDRHLRLHPVATHHSERIDP